MSSRVQNVFLAIGVVAVVVMLFTFDVSYAELWGNLCHASYWCVAVFALWALIYAMNATTWRILLDGHHIPFWHLWRMTVTGFALNYTTPVGLLGGEPYRILALKPHVGADRAASSVTLFSMTHIFSHFIFWAFSIVLYVCLRSMSGSVAVLLGVFAVFCIAGILLFIRGYQRGLVYALVSHLASAPLVGGMLSRMLATKRDLLLEIDRQITSCNTQRVALATLCEFVGRIVGCLELYFILLTQTTSISFADCIFIQAFQSLFSNLLFFIPLQAGTREGGFAIAMSELGSLAQYGLYTGLITRVRELLWIAIGLVFIKIDNRKKNEQLQSPAV